MPAEDRGVAGDGGAVPPRVLELFLAVPDALHRALRHRHHRVGVAVTQEPLPPHQARDVLAVHPRGRVRGAQLRHEPAGEARRGVG